MNELSNFEIFKFLFNKMFDGDLYEMIEALEEDFDGVNSKLPFDIEYEELDEEEYDSYGYEDTKLRRVVHVPRLDLHVMFEGTRRSFSGEEWHGFREVKPVVKKITTYE